MISALHVSNSDYSVDTGHGFKYLIMVSFLCSMSHFKNTNFSTYVTNLDS